MSPRRPNLTPSRAAARLGVSTKALRLYEQRGLLVPGRSAAGWRLYAPDDLERAATIVSLRALGLSLAQVARVLGGDPDALAAGLAAHEDRLGRQARDIQTALGKVRALRDDIRRGQRPDASALNAAVGEDAKLAFGFELPWPWAGEWFEARDIGGLNFITGPLGSGKTRFAERLAAELPDASFVGLDRFSDPAIARSLAEDAAMAARADDTLEWLKGEGAVETGALRALVALLEADAPSILVIDMVEEGLCAETQRALMARLRLKPGRKRALFLMTRSSSILDLDLARGSESVFYCPANHGLPFRASPYPGGHGYESVTTCVATPEVRARTACRAGPAGERSDPLRDAHPGSG